MASLYQAQEHLSNFRQKILFVPADTRADDRSCPAVWREKQEEAVAEAQAADWS
jgi:hypothetical protein